MPFGDHPRSRGVYNNEGGRLFGVLGSSPLARGLPSQRSGNSCRPGIIPARAGFTRKLLPGLRSNWDHPRSRGVYHAHVEIECAHGGIIPARAGFTHHQNQKTRPKQDHPRSRGVYAWTPSKFSHTRGSSPLARGLLVDPDRRRRRPGIIPARAGFTRGYDGLAFSHWDHPRSRGVYHSMIPSLPFSLGSSPLARGLLARNTMNDVPPDHPRSRGVYRRRRRVSRRAGDHPRSRGVYRTAFH